MPQERLELGEGHLDRVHIWAVGRQVEDLSTAIGNRLADAGHLMGRQVVEHHDIATLEGRCQDVLDVHAEGIAIHGAIEHPGCGHAGEPQAGDEGHRLPVAEWRLVTAALTNWRPAIEPRHLGVHSSLVEEDQALGIKEWLCGSPQLAPRGHVRPILLGCSQRFF